MNYPSRHARAAVRFLSTIGLISVTVLVGCSDEDSPAAPDASNPAAPPVGFESRFATVNGIRLHYVQGGQGDLVVLLHGWPETWYEWEAIMPGLADRYTVVAPDLRGGGASDKPATDTGYDKRLMAEDVHALVGQLGFDRVLLVGHDIGMMVAYAYASMYPNEVRGLVLMDAPLPGIEPIWSEILKNPLSWHFDFHADVELAAQLVEGHERDYLTAFYRKFGASDMPMSAAHINEYVRAYSAPGAMAAGFEWYKGVAIDVVDNQQAQTELLTMPVLAMGGEFSSGPFMEAVVEAVAADVRTEVVMGSGHWLAAEAPEAVSTALDRFFVEVEQSGR